MYEMLLLQLNLFNGMKSMQLKFTLVEGTSVHVKLIILYNVQVYIYFTRLKHDLGLEIVEIL